VQHRKQEKIPLRLSFFDPVRGIASLRPDDMEKLWGHLVLDALLLHLPAGKIHYWHDKQKHGVDFVWAPRPPAPSNAKGAPPPG
jgi:hypothetical protein